MESQKLGVSFCVSEGGVEGRGRGREKEREREERSANRIV